MFPFLLLFVRFQTSIAAQHDLVPPDRFRLNARSLHVLSSGLTAVKGPTPTYVSTNPEDFKKLNILFLYDQHMSKRNRDIFEYEVEAVNIRLSVAIKAPVLTDVRLPRLWNETSQSCEEPRCWDIWVEKPIPDEYTLPCRYPNGTLVPGQEATEKPHELVEIFNKAGYTHVIFVYVHNDGVNLDGCPPTASGDGIHIPFNYTPFLAAAYHCRQDPLTNRPTHGTFIWCREPSTLRYGERSTTFLHETINVLTAYSLIGVGTPTLNCTRNSNFIGETAYHFPSHCEGKLWKSIDVTRMDVNGTMQRKKAYLAITKHVKEAAQAYFKCPEVEGAELNTAEFAVSGVNIYTAMHWSDQFFADEIQSNSAQPHRRLSPLTLASLKDSGWYEVDLTKAEPPLYSTPKLSDGCKIVNEDCAKTIGDTRDKSRSLKFVAPYCDDADSNPDQIISPRCSDDGSMMLVCEVSYATHYCPVVNSLPDDFAQLRTGYDSMSCLDATIQGPKATAVGGRVGTIDTMCVTFTSLSTWTGTAKKMLPLCVQIKCREDVVALFLKPSEITCEFNCTKDKSNQLVNFTITSECNQALGPLITLICPDFDRVCLNVTTSVPEATNSTFSTFKPSPPTVQTTTQPPKPPTTSDKPDGLQEKTLPSGTNYNEKLIAFIATAGVVFAKVCHLIF